MAEKEYPSDEVVVLRATCDALQRQVIAQRETLLKIRDCVVIEEPWDKLQEIYAAGNLPMVKIRLEYSKVSKILEEEYGECFEFPVQFDREGKAE